MPSRGMSICRKVGCNKLLREPGYCEDHKVEENPLRNLERKNRGFYSSYKWTMASRRHRAAHPLCEECKRKGLTQKGELVHHEPALDILLAKGLNPCSSQYLETLCFNCHQGHLSAKRL